MRRFLLRLWSFLRPAIAEQDLTREIGAHLTLLQDEYERRGLSPEEAYRAARIALGGVEQTKELHRDARSFIWLTDARQDIAHAVRLLRRSPSFTLTAAVSLAIAVSVPLSLDARVIVFTAVLSLLAALASGLAPAFKGSRADPAMALKEDSSSSLGGSRLRSALVVGQVALSLLLIVVAGLFLRALRYAGSTDPGFDPHGVEIASLDLSMSASTDSTRLLFWRDVIDGVRQLPDVEAATLARVPPGGFEGIGLGSIAAAGTPSSGEPFVPAWNIVDSGYFATLRIPLVAGRDFSGGDVAGAQSVAIVGEGIARRFWPEKNAVGEYLVVTSPGPNGVSSNIGVLIVGIARDVKSSSLIDGLAGSYVYLPLQQNDTSLMSLMTTQMTIVARSRQGQRITAELSALVRKLNPNLAIVRSETVEDSMALGLGRSGSL